MITVLLAKQIAVFFLMMAAGFLLVRRGLLPAAYSRTLSVICIYIILPCVMIHSFQVKYSPHIRTGFLVAILAALLIHILLILLTGILGKLFSLTTVEKASLIYSNAGNLVIPMVAAVLGEEWEIYASAFLCVQMILLWTHGQSLMEGRRSFNLKKIFCNLNLIAVIIGIILFFARITLPSVIGNTLGQISACIGPVSMIMLGMSMAEVNWRHVISYKRIYGITALKMLGMPLLILLFLKYSPLAGMVSDGKTILLISLMAVITPSATTIVQLAQLYEEEPLYAGTLNVATTAVSILTMPLMAALYMM